MSRKLVLFLILGALGLLWFLAPADVTREEAALEPVEASSEPGVIVVDLMDDTSAEDVAALGSRLGLELVLSSEVSEDEALYRAQVADPAAALAALSREPLVEAAEPLIELTAFGYPDDPDYAKQWNMRMIGMPLPWRAGRGDGVRVAVIDTGVAVVEDLEGTRIEAGRSFVPGAPTAVDDHGHGTHVAGTIAQTTHNGLGVTGVAPEAIILPYKALSRTGAGAHDWVAAAIDQAVDDGADVINLSLGGRYSKVVDVAVRKAVAEGVVVVAAAGNTGREGLGCPACLKPVIAVSAVGPDDRVAPYSSWGRGVEIAAPGGNLRMSGGGIIQDTIDGKGGHAYRPFQGTSMASPHVAGAVAVLIGMGLDGDAAVDALLSTARTSTPGVIDARLGHGRLDLGAAVKSVLLRQRGARFAVVGGLVGLLALLAGLPAGVVFVAAASGAATAGGMFFLPWLPVGPNLATELLSRGLISWPAALGAPDVTQFPLWASALLPMTLAFFFGWSRLLGGLIAGLCAGFGFSLFYGAMAGTLDLWMMGPQVGQGWLVVNGALCLITSLAVLGVQRMRRVEQ